MEGGVEVVLDGLYKESCLGCVSVDVCSYCMVFDGEGEGRIQSSRPRYFCSHFRPLQSVAQEKCCGSAFLSRSGTTFEQSWTKFEENSR